MELKKYLLVASFAGADEESPASSGAVALGFYDTIEDALARAKEDLESCAWDYAEGFCDEDSSRAELEDYIDNYLNYYQHEPKDRESFLQKVGDSTTILEHEFVSNGGDWSHSNTYIVVKLM